MNVEYIAYYIKSQECLVEYVRNEHARGNLKHM
jgi:hypothetical protein